MLVFMTKRINMTGERYGSLVVSSFSYSTDKTSYWVCRCDCGKEKIVSRLCLTTGQTVSCGCYRRSLDAQVAIKRKKHGHSAGHLQKNRSKTYNSWSQMIQRCYNPKSVGYKDYGAVGVSVCERWHSFENFLEDMGERPEGKTLDRFPDFTGNYQPNNCRWATPAEQNYNRKLYANRKDLQIEKGGKNVNDHVTLRRGCRSLSLTKQECQFLLDELSKGCDEWSPITD